MDSSPDALSARNDGKKTHRIAFLLRDLGEGGAERSALRLANGLARRGQAVTLLLLKARGPMLASVAPEIEIVDLGGSFFALLSELRKRRPDFLLPVYTAMRALLSKLLLKGPFQVVLSQRNMFTLDRGPIQTRLRFLRSRLLYPLASSCVCISQGVAEEMRTLGLIDPAKIEVIYNPVVTDELKAQAEEPPNHPWFAPHSPPVILGVGRLGDQKDFATLIEAFALLAPSHPDIRLLILGEGKQRAMLEKLVRDRGLSERATMPGYVSNPYPCMKHAALFALTSRFEGFGNVVAEALACGCPVASTDCRSGPAEILDHGRYGELARVGDPADMARAMEKALKNSPPPEVLRKRASYFSEARAVEGYLNLLDRLRSEGGRG